MNKLTLKHEDWVKHIIDKEVLVCHSHLVVDLIKNGWEKVTPFIEFDEIKNIRLTEAEAKEMGWDSLEDAKSASEDTKEVFEWWAISDWFANRLLEIGAVVAKTPYGICWGRTETGQSLTMDADINAVVAKLLLD